MKKKFSVEQIVSVLKQSEVGVPVAELIRKVGISEQTFYRWKAKYMGLEVDQVRQLKQMGEENARLYRNCKFGEACFPVRCRMPERTWASL